MVAFVPMNINREESIETVLMHVDHAINYGDDLEPQVLPETYANVINLFVYPAIHSHDAILQILNYRNRKTRTQTSRRPTIRLLAAVSSFTVCLSCVYRCRN